MGEPTPEERAREVPDAAVVAFIQTRYRLEESSLDSVWGNAAREVIGCAIDALAAAGLRAVPEGHAVIDGEVMRLVEVGFTPCCADSLYASSHSPGCSKWAPLHYVPVAGADEKEARDG